MESTRMAAQKRFRERKMPTERTLRIVHESPKRKKPEKERSLKRVGLSGRSESFMACPLLDCSRKHDRLERNSSMLHKWLREKGGARDCAPARLDTCPNVSAHRAMCHRAPASSLPIRAADAHLLWRRRVYLCLRARESTLPCARKRALTCARACVRACVRLQPCVPGCW
eukprot:6205757-Pleurochrysis_carterae.AAC.4